MKGKESIYVKYVTEDGIPYYYNTGKIYLKLVSNIIMSTIGTNSTQWERPDGYDSDVLEDAMLYCENENDLKFNLVDDNGTKLTLLQELKRMRYINVVNSEIQTILSGELSVYGLKKLQVSFVMFVVLSLLTFKIAISFCKCI